MKMRALALLGTTVAALAVAATASAHAHVSPPVGVTGNSQAFTLSVPTEKENANTTKIELTPGDGFSVGSIAPAPGWKIDIQKTGTSDEAVVNKVTWSGGSVPLGQAAFLQFLGSSKNAGTYSFTVKQTYSDGSVVDWAGPESSDTPAPTVQLKSSLGGGGSSILGIVALVLAALALLVALAGALTGRGGRAVA
ncbi:MAG: hypothetical protein QOF76_3238 [Solirubrobacteraceae bacterium]|jgi:uncharacterized protein YcnI|nr:hypothetical protein [Solirubrobacteraceae bacterium]